jgi:hypothetical protein
MVTREARRREARRLGTLLPVSLLRTLRSRLSVWETSACGDPFTAHHSGQLARYLAGLRTLARSEPDRMSAALQVALALGPRATLPCSEDLGSLLDAAMRSDVDAVDLGIAWGCGWGHAASPGHAWRERWDAAMLALCCLVERSVYRTSRWLSCCVAGFEGALHAAGEAEHRYRLVSYAHQIAMELSLAPPQGRPARHALLSWRPDDCRLAAFVATAVRGTARLPVRGGAFATSMLATLLREDQLLRVDAAEFSVCHVCNAGLIAGAPYRHGMELSSLRRGLYDLGRCPDCGASPDPTRTYRVARKNWLLVPADWGGRHVAVDRRRCTACGNLYPAGHERCPLCFRQASNTRRLTSIWVRRSGR